jgi:O-antigen ligase
LQAVSWQGLIFGAAAALALVSATGLTVRIVFHEPDTLKYAVTVGGPALVAALALTRRPLRLLVGLAIVVAPVDFVATLGGLQVTPLAAVLVLAAPLAALTVRPASAGWLGLATVAAVLLLTPAIAFGASAGSYVTWLAETVVTGWLVFHVARTPGGTRFVVCMIVLSAAIQAVLAVYEYRSGHQLNLYSSSGTSTAAASYFFNYGTVTRSDGTLPDPISLGNVLALATPLVVCLAVSERRWGVRLALLIVGAAIVLGLVVSYSRMSWIGAGAGLVVCLLLLPPRKRIPTTLAVAGTLAVVLALGVTIGGSALRTRFESLLAPTNTASSYATTARGDQLRVRLWNAALATFASEPITGTGFGLLTPQLDVHGVSVPDAGHAQSWYLEILGEAGVLGGLALLGVIAAAARELLRGFARHRLWVAGATGAGIATLVTWSTDITPRYVQVSAMIAALLAVIAAQGSRGSADRASRVRFAPVPGGNGSGSGNGSGLLSPSGQWPEPSRPRSLSR